MKIRLKKAVAHIGVTHPVGKILLASDEGGFYYVESGHGTGFEVPKSDADIVLEEEMDPVLDNLRRMKM